MKSELASTSIWEDDFNIFTAFLFPFLMPQITSQHQNRTACITAGSLHAHPEHWIPSRNARKKTHVDEGRGRLLVETQNNLAPTRHPWRGRFNSPNLYLVPKVPLHLINISEILMSDHYREILCTCTARFWSARFWCRRSGVGPKSLHF